MIAHILNIVFEHNLLINSRDVFYPIKYFDSFIKHIKLKLLLKGFFLLRSYHLIILPNNVIILVGSSAGFADRFDWNNISF